MKLSRPTFFLLVALCLLTAVRYFLAVSIGLSPDETYYYLWSERLDWSYYSKGPGVAVAIWLGTTLFGPTELGVRFLSPLLAFGSSLLLYAFASRLYNKRTGLWVVAFVNCLPLFNVGGLVMTIDPLSIFFWIAAMMAFWEAVNASPRFTVWWFVSGLLIGTGFLAKYTNAFQLLSILLVLLSVRRLRKQILWPGFPVLLGGFSLGLIPPILWNAERGWITVTHLLDRGGISTEKAWNPSDFFEFLGVHLGVYSPLMFIGIVIATVAAVKEARQHFRPRFLLCFGLPIVLFYFGLSLKQVGEGNWTAPGFVTLAIPTAAYWLRRHEEGRRHPVLVGVALAFALGITLLALGSEGIRKSGLPGRLGFEWPYKADPSGRLRGWETASERLHKERLRLETELGKPLFLIANKYGTAAALSFYLPDKRMEGPGHPPIYTPETQDIQNQYAFWPRYDENVLPEGEPLPQAHGLAEYTEEAGINLFHGRSALFVTDEIRNGGKSPGSPHEVLRGFVSWRRLGDIVVERNGQEVRVLRLFLCEDYKGFDL